MRILRPHIAFLVLLCLAPMNAIAQQASRTPSQFIARDGLDQGIRNYVAAKLQARPYFQGASADACTEPNLTEPGFSEISVIDCTYTESGLTAWVRLAIAPPDLLADWILNAARLCRKPEVCAIRLAGDTWISNQYSFPIAGNIVEPDSSTGGSGAGAINIFFVNGVTVARPSILPETSALTIDLQKQCALALLASANGLAAAPVTGDKVGSCTVITVRQVSRPAAVRQDIYVKHGDPTKTEAQRLAEVGSSCPVGARKAGWLAVSRRAFVEGWRTRRHELFDAAARAIQAGTAYLGRIDCPGS